jgi:hypothetical protein
LSNQSFIPSRLVATALAATLLCACGDGEIDLRNALYTGYATSGEQFTLAMDFDSNRATFLGAGAGSVATETTFSPDSVAGTYVFGLQSGAGKTARFRVIDGLVVGNFVINGSVRPFVASRRFAQSVRDAAGTYNILGVNETAAGTGETIVQAASIDVGGTLRICTDSTIASVDNCPAGSLQRSELTLAGDVFTGKLVSNIFVTIPITFRIALAGDEKVLLNTDVVPGGSRAFRIGLADSANFRRGRGWGGTTEGSWSSADFDANNYSSEGVTANGLVTTYSGSVAGAGLNAPKGIRSFQNDRGYIVQNTQLTVLVGTAKSTSAGFMQLSAQ